MSKNDFIKLILSLRNQGDLHDQYLFFEENQELYRYAPVLMYLLLHPRTKNHRGTLAWVLTQADPRYYYPIFMHLIRMESYEPSLWIYDYLIKSIPSWNADDKEIVRAIAIDATLSCKIKYKRIMFEEIINVVDNPERD